MSDNRLAGWDLGGAHLKLAVAEGDGTLVTVRQVPCALWQGMAALDRALESVREDLTGVTRHAVTMTGELVDLFDDRAAGVTSLVEAMRTFAGDRSLAFYDLQGTFVAAETALAQPLTLASMNWRATQRLAANRLSQGLLIDVGSTTTDILPFADGGGLTRGLMDDERLVFQELVYSGVTRTPVMAVAREVPFDGAWQGVMAEHFATMADVYRLTGELGDEADQHPAADGRDKSLPASARRLARMLGRDVNPERLRPWQHLARHLAGRQRDQLQCAVDRVLSYEGWSFLAPDAPLVGAGIGRFLVRRLAAAMDRPYRDFADLVQAPEALRDATACCAPAVAVALLARDQ